MEVKNFLPPSSSLVWDQLILSKLKSILNHKLVFQHVWKRHICVNLVRIWFIFSTCTFVLNAVKEPGIFFLSHEFWGVGCAVIKALLTGNQWVNASQIAFNIIIFSPSHTLCKIVESQRDL